jgi:hypothetical protein
LSCWYVLTLLNGSKQTVPLPFLAFALIDFVCIGTTFCCVGGRDNFQHCLACGMCIDKNLFHNHNCKAGKYRSNCPVCQEYLFSSRSASHEMPCGHAIHWDCFKQLAAHDSRCPVCKRTAESWERMLPTWQAMADSVAIQPIPPELARVVNITCNDCEKSDDARAWHFLGVQCQHCQSFNTVVERVVLSGVEAHEFLEMNRIQLDMPTKTTRILSPMPNRSRNRRRRSIDMVSSSSNSTLPAAVSVVDHDGEKRQNSPPQRRRMNRRRSAF